MLTDRKRLWMRVTFRRTCSHADVSYAELFRSSAYTAQAYEPTPYGRAIQYGSVPPIPPRLRTLGHACLKRFKEYEMRREECTHYTISLSCASFNLPPFSKVPSFSHVLFLRIQYTNIVFNNETLYPLTAVVQTILYHQC